MLGRILLTNATVRGASRTREIGINRVRAEWYLRAHQFNIDTEKKKHGFVDYKTEAVQWQERDLLLKWKR